MSDQISNYTPTPIPGVTPEEVVTVHSRHVACDGGNAALGHPTIWLRITGEEITCPYCSRTFRLAPGAGEESGH